MKKILLTGIILFAISTGYAQNTWTQKADFGGDGRQFAVSFSIGNKGYTGTGTSGTSSYNDFWEYDPGTDAWTQKADFGGGARSGATGFSLNGKGYIGTGSTGQLKNDFWEYDPGSNNWAQKADFGGDVRQDAISFSIDDKGYIGTGSGMGNIPFSDFWEYDPGADTWTQKANFGGGVRFRATGISIGNKGYIGLGGNDPGIFNFYNDFWEYDPATDAWTQKASFGGSARELATGFSIDTKGYIGTGFDPGARDDFWEYDPGTDTWAQKGNFAGTARWSAGSFSIGNKGYIGAGEDGNLNFPTDFWEYTPGNNIITTNDFDANRFCAGSDINVSFSSTGTSNAGNTFTAQLSDAAGSFASPVDIGSLMATEPGNITATIPSNTPQGNGYRIRVIADNPVSTGTDNGTDLEVVPIATASISYPGSPYAPTGTATVTLTGQGGGAYSSTSGLIIDSETGAINLATSTPGTYIVIYNFSNGPCTFSTATSLTINSLPAARISYPGSPYCATGTATVTHTGQGGGTYSSTSGLVINAVNGAINLATSKPGTYAVTYKFRIGTKYSTTTAYVTIKALPKATITAGTISCYGGLTTITVNASGTAPLKYKLSTGSNFQGNNTFIVGANTYTVTVQDAGGCSVTTNPILIAQPLPISIALNAGIISCYGGTTTLTITAGGGIPGYTYSLNGCAFQSSNKFTANATTCAVTVKDSKGCTAVKSVNINQPSAVSVSLYSRTNVSCYGGNNGSLTVRATGGTQPYTYKINTAASYQGTGTFNNLMKGTYSITVKDKNGCTAVITGISISQPSTALSLTLSKKTDASCAAATNGSITVNASGGTSPLKYSLNNGSYGTSSTFSSLRAGTYTVNAKDANSCIKSITVVINGTGKCNTLSVTDPGITGADIRDGTWLKATAFPNPSETEFTLALTGNSNEAVEIRVIDMYGRPVHYAKGSANQSYKFGQQFAAGIYIVEIVQGKNVKTLKIIKGN